MQIRVPKKYNITLSRKRHYRKIYLYHKVIVLIEVVEQVAQLGSIFWWRGGG